MKKSVESPEEIRLENSGSEPCRSTGKFRIGTGAFMSRLFFLYGVKPAIVLFAAVSIAVVLALAVDYRFAIVALMIVFLLVPAVFSWLHISNGMTPLHSFNIAWHTLALTKEGIKTEILKPLYKKKNEDDIRLEGTRDITGWKPVRSFAISYQDIRDSLGGADGMTFTFNIPDSAKNKSESGFIAVPRKAFPNIEDYDSFIKYIREQVGG